jgi:hypothetical protein
MCLETITETLIFGRKIINILLKKRIIIIIGHASERNDVLVCVVFISFYLRWGGGITTCRFVLCCAS